MFMKYNWLNQLFSEKDEFEDLFSDFDFNLLESPDFKEDAVREEIVFPILKKLGYSASSKNKIIRSKNLKHPFHYFGVKKYNVNIVPDYTFEIDDESKWILDAKRPTENITEGKNVGQAYSYAVHPEIQSDFFCLCNGKEVTIFSVKKNKLILNFHIKDLKNYWNQLEEILGPEFVKKPYLKEFHPDFGLFLLRIADDEKFYSPLKFPFEALHFIGKLNEKEYSINGTVGIKHESFEGNKYAATFDFQEKEYQEFLSILPIELRKNIIKSLSSQPFRYYNSEPEKFHFNIYATLGTAIHTNEDESYLPLKVHYFEKK